MLFVLFVLALPLTVMAQEPPDLTGTYSYSGAYGSETYTGTMNLTGAAPFYRQTYSDETASSETFTGDVAVIGQGNVLASTLGDGECGVEVVAQRSDGVMIGLWNDFYTTTAAPIAVDVYTPATPGEWAGTWTMDGTYATGQRYTATMEVTQNEGGWYDMVYTFDYDEVEPDAVPFTEVGIGMVSGSHMGIAFAESDLSNCGVWLATFDGSGSFNSVWVDEMRNVGTETGSKQ